MKKTDIAMIILIASVCALGTYFIVSATPIGKSVNESVKVKTVDPISAEVDKPDERVFNATAINPSVEVQISNTDGSGNTVSSDAAATDDSTRAEE